MEISAPACGEMPCSLGRVYALAAQRNAIHWLIAEHHDGAVCNSTYSQLPYLTSILSTLRRYIIISGQRPLSRLLCLLIFALQRRFLLDSVAGANVPLCHWPLLLYTFDRSQCTGARLPLSLIIPFIIQHVREAQTWFSIALYQWAVWQTWAVSSISAYIWTQKQLYMYQQL